MSDKIPATTFVVCGVVLERDGKYLLVQEKQPKAYGQWNLPAGKVDEGESLEQAAIREAEEETGFQVELGEHLLVQHGSMGSPVLHAYRARIIGGELSVPEDELLAADWFTYEKVKNLDLRAPDYILQAIAATR